MSHSQVVNPTNTGTEFEFLSMKAYQVRSFPHLLKNSKTDSIIEGCTLLLRCEDEVASCTADCAALDFTRRLSPFWGNTQWAKSEYFCMA